MSSRAKLGGICLLSYAIGVLLSPYLLPADFFTGIIIGPFFTANDNDAASSSKKSSFEKAVLEAQLKYAETYKQIIMGGNNDHDNHDDPFHDVDIVLHRNGEPDPCVRQYQQQQQQLGRSGGLPPSLFGKILDRLGMNTVDITTSNDTTSADNNNNNDNNKDSPSFLFSPLSQSILHSAERFETQISFDSKYDLDAILTHAFAMETKPSMIFPPNDILSSCGPNWKQPPKKKSNGNGQTQQQHYLDGNSQVNYNSLSSMIKYCDMGIDRTPLQPDHSELVRVPYARSLPCHFHTREGVRVTSLRQLADLAREVTNKKKTKNKKTKNGDQGECKMDDEKNNDQTCSSSGDGDDDNDDSARKELHLYAVSAGRVFMFAPKYVGEVFELPHVKGPEGLPVSLEVMSLTPRVFDIYNFFDRAESAAIVDKALKETSETHRMKRSSTGASGYNLNSKRTSENGFDTHGKEAMIVKHRCMDILGFDEYVESLTDGLQVLRYNLTVRFVRSFVLCCFVLHCC